MEYTRDADALTFTRVIGEHYRFRFKAERIRQERTGVHARVAVALNGVDLAWGYFNVDKDEDRVRFTNSAYKMIAPDHRRNGLSEYPTDYLRKDLNDFCAGLWSAQVRQDMPALMDGAEERVGPAFQVRPFVMDGGGTIIFGPPGRGKSYVMLLIAVTLDAGLGEDRSPWPAHNGPRRVLIINLERSARSLAQRIGNVNAAMGLPRSRPLHVLNARGKSLEDVMPSVRTYVREEKIDTIFLDSMSRAGLGDLADNAVGNKIVDRLNEFETWVALGHTPRGDEGHVFGTQMFDAAADLTVKLSSQQEDGGPLGVGLELSKKNDVPWEPMRILAMEFDELGLVRARPARSGEFPDVEAGKKMSMRQRVMEFLQNCDGGAADATTVAEQTGLSRTNISTMFTKDRDHFVFVRKQGRSALYGVLSESP